MSNVVKAVRMSAVPAISLRARALGLDTVDGLKLAVLKQRPVWWRGHAYHCPLCNLDFVDARRAAEHVVLEQHPVLRMDVALDPVHAAAADALLVRTASWD